MPRFIEQTDYYCTDSEIDRICGGCRGCKNRSYDPDKDICKLCMEGATKVTNESYINQLNTWYVGDQPDEHWYVEDTNE